MTARLLVQESGGEVQVALHREGHVAPEAMSEPEPFQSPLGAEELDDLRWYLEEYLRAPFAVYEDRGNAIAERLQGWGERLFAALLGPGRPGRDAYLRGREARDCQLWFSSRSPEFLSLPWELLHDPEGDRRLALDLAGLSRTVAEPAQAAELPSGEALRVLMVIARPAGERDVGYQTIARPLLARLEPVAGRVELEVLRPPTFERFGERLRQATVAGEPYQIVHFDGHGTFGRRFGGGGVDPLRYAAEAPKGHLVFESDTGSDDVVPADQVAPVLEEARVPLVVLNACQSATLGATSVDAAVATRLLAGGAAAVVAMGYSVYAVAAAEFMAAFYEALFRGEPVSRAVAAGRRQMDRAPERPSPKGPLPLADWLVPVHYGRREVSFPHLRRRESRGELSLEQALAGYREPEATPEGVHPEGDLAPVDDVFFGRDVELLELERALRLRRVIVVHGVGGTGKTELAKGFARWLQATGGLDGPRLVFFHSFEPGLPSFGLGGVISSVGLRLFGAQFARLDGGQRTAAVLAALQQARILLIWDNFETVASMPDPAGATPPLDAAGRDEVLAFLAAVRKDAKGGVLITSRSPEPWLGDDVHRLELSGLRREDALAYADNLLAPHPAAQERRQHRAFAELMEHLGGHPLSLRLTLPRLAESPAAEVLAALRGEAADLPAGFEGGEGRLESLGACVHYSFRHLPDEQRQRLPALTLFEGVADADVLTILSQQDGVPPRFAGVSREAWGEALDACAAAGLLTSLGGGMYRLHPALPGYLTALWRQQAGDDYEGELEAARLASITAHAVLGQWLLQQIRTGSAETAFAVLDVERRTFGAAAGEALERALYGEAQAILQPLDELWDRRGLLDEARGWVERCREVLEGAESEPPDLDTAGGALWLFMVISQANRSLRAGDLAAAETEYDAIRVMLESSESDQARQRLGIAYHQLGRVSQERGDLSSAESWYRRSLEIRESLRDRPGMAKSYHQLGMVSQRRGDLSFAESWYRRSLEILESLADRPRMATSYHQLGRVSELQADLSSAESWYRDSLEILESLGDRPGMAKSYHQLGVVSQLQGDLSSAESWYRRSLEIEESLGDRPGMATSYHQLGIVSQDHGDLSSAESWYRRSLEIVESLGHRPGMALTYAQLGVLEQQRENQSEALEYAVRCVALFPNEFPSPHTGSGPEDLARLTAELGMPALEETWQRITGEPLPDAVRHGVERMIEAAR